MWLKAPIQITRTLTHTAQDYTQELWNAILNHTYIFSRKIDVKTKETWNYWKANHKLIYILYTAFDSVWFGRSETDERVFVNAHTHSKYSQMRWKHKKNTWRHLHDHIINSNRAQFDSNLRGMQSNENVCTKGLNQYHF